MPVQVQCGGCGGTFRVRESAAGKAGKCPKCGIVIKVPEVLALPDSESINDESGITVEPTEIPAAASLPANPAPVAADVDITPLPTIAEVRKFATRFWQSPMPIVLMVIVFLYTTMSPNGLRVLMNYSALLLAAIMLGQRVSQRFRPRLPAAVILPWVLPVAAIYAWTQFDYYEETWQGGSTTYHDWQRRNGRVEYRRVSRDGWSAEGPMAGDPRKLHGHWRYVIWKPKLQHDDNWFWYGEEISQGEWELRNRK